MNQYDFDSSMNTFDVEHILPIDKDKKSEKFKYIDGIYRHTFNKFCKIENWNDVTTFKLPRYGFLRKLADGGITGIEGLSDGELRLLSAYLYHDEVVVTTTRQRTEDIGEPIYCRYYDCNRIEIPNSAFKSFFFPMTAVHCARRMGAHFISLSFKLDLDAPKPIPFVRRLDKEPPHELGVCAGQIYGADRKWMDIVDFVEHHKIIGFTMFYFTVFRIDEYSRDLLDEYVRTGYAEVTKVNTEYTEGYLYLHMIQLHDCFFRARHHSKWMLNIDHDEFLVPTKSNFLEYINSLSAKVAEVIFPMRKIHKLEDSLKVYKTSREVENNIQLVKYNRTTVISFLHGKVLVQPTKVEAIHVHWAYGRAPGYFSFTVPKSVALVNHYRGDAGLLSYGWTNETTIEVYDKSHVNLLKKRVVQTVEYVFKKHNM